MLKKATKDKLNLKVLTVNKNEKEGMVVITVEVSESGVDNPRSVINYSVFQPIPKDLNGAIASSQLDALGVWYGEVNGEEDFKKKTLTALEEKPEDLDFEPKPTKKTQSKKTTSKKATAKTKAAKVAKEEEVDMDLDDLEVEEEDLEESTSSIIFDKTQLGHKAALKPIIIGALGMNWKDDQKSKDAVSKLINEINGVLPVMDIDGEILPTFRKYCQAKLRSAA